MFHVIIYLLFILNILNCCYGIEPVSVATVVTAGFLSFGIGSYNYLKCKMNECCDDNWVKFNVEGLKSDFQKQLFGQHLVMDIVPRAVHEHMIKETPSKALVMSFHGGTGNGKNLVSKLIAENMLKEGTKSQYYHLYLGPLFSHLDSVYEFKEKFRTDVEKATKNCERNLFIFDEVDKMAPGVLDVLSPYVDFHPSIQGVNYRKNVFIFLSNSGGTDISKAALEFWSDGKERESIKLRDVEPLITQGAYNEVGGLHRSSIVKKDLIDVYVPFLPLEKKHVKLCIEANLRDKQKRVTPKVTDTVAEELLYYPPETNLYSVSGCKKVDQKVDLFA